MAGKDNITDSGNEISEAEMKSLARTLFPILRDYLLSEQGQKDYAEWKKQTTEYKT